MPRPQGAPIPIIDTHIHLFDPTRPQGAPVQRPARCGRGADSGVPRSLSQAGDAAGLGRCHQSGSEPVGRRQPLGARSFAARHDHRRRHRQSRARQARIQGVLRSLPEAPALPRHPVRQPVGTRHREAGRESGLHRRPQAAGRGRPRARHGESADRAARVDAQDQRQGAESAHRPRPSAELRADAGRAAGLRRRAQGIRQAAADLRQAVRDPPPGRRQRVDRPQHATATSSICSSPRSAKIASCSGATGPTATASRRSIRSSRSRRSTSHRSRERSRRNTSGEIRSPPTSG